VVQDSANAHRAALIDGHYWALFVSRQPEAESVAHSRKVIQVAKALSLSGPWTVARKPVLLPPPGNQIDGLNCDTPTAYWFADREEVLVFYKAYPRQPQTEQPHAPFGSALLAATWHPQKVHARRLGVVLRPEANQWAAGWVGGLQLLAGRKGSGWLGLLNASRTPPEQISLREPAPSMGGWATCSAEFPDQAWSLDKSYSPFISPESVTDDMKTAGIQVNFWRHHLLTTPEGQTRIFFNSGSYGEEQMYSLVAQTKDR